jgi:PAS domain S-box-containing protein
MTSHKTYGLSYSWLLGLIVSMTVVVIVIGGMGLSFLEDRLVKSEGENLALVAVDVADKLTLQLIESYGDIQLLGDIASRVTWEREHWTAYLHSVKTAYPRFDSIGLIGPTGRVIATTDEANMGTDVSRIKWFTDVLISNTGVQVKDVGPDELAGGIDTVSFAAPLTRDPSMGATGFQGAVVGRISTQTLEAIMTGTIRNRIVKQSNSENFQYQVMNQYGEVFIDSNLFHKGNINLITMGLASAQLALLGKPGYVEEEDLRRHVQAITGYARLTALNERSNVLRWGVLVRVDREAVLAPIRSILWKTGLWGGGLFLPLLAVLFWIVRKLEQTKQYEQHTQASLKKTHDFLQSMLATVEAFFICVDLEGIVTTWTPRAEAIFGISLLKVHGQPFKKLPIQWNWEELFVAMEKARTTLKSVRVNKIRLALPNGNEMFLKLTVSPICDDRGMTYVIMGEDISDRLVLEYELVQAQKLESIGHLAAGIAHEINTPTQFVGDNVRFLSDSFAEIVYLLEQYRLLLAAAKTGNCPEALIETCEVANRKADLAYLLAEIPKAIEQTSEGVDRVATIVRAMKEFSHPGSKEKTVVDLNKAIESTVTVARNEWKYLADLQTNLDPSLPPVPCLVGEFNQVVLNMIVNATHAIADVVKGTGGKGAITIGTSHVGDFVEVRISDTGMGIPDSIRHKIFDPFFTTKEAGRGTGQGLAIARSVVVDKHGGTIAVDSEVGKGTTFLIRLPLNSSLAHPLIEAA